MRRPDDVTDARAEQSNSAQNKKSGTERTHYRRPRPKPVPDHLVPCTPSLTDIPPLEVIARYRRDDGFTMTGEGVEVLVGEDPAQAATVVLPIRVGGVVVMDHNPGRR